MRSTEILNDGFARIPEIVGRAIDGATREELVRRLDPDANSLAWLAWHIGREQDLQLAELAGIGQVWVADGWRERMGLDVADDDAGYGNSSAQVARIDVSAELLMGYLDAVAVFAADLLVGLTDEELDEVVDTSWDPPVTRGARLMSILGDAFEHGGQAGYLRGLIDRAR